VKTLTGCCASFLALYVVHHLWQSIILIVLLRVHSAQLWPQRYNGRVQLGTYTVWILTMSIAEFETGTILGSGVEFDLYANHKPPRLWGYSTLVDDLYSMYVTSEVIPYMTLWTLSISSFLGSIFYWIFHSFTVHLDIIASFIYPTERTIRLL